MDIIRAPIRAKPNGTKAGESFAEKKRLDLWFQTVAVRGRVSIVVANLCVEGKQDLETGLLSDDVTLQLLQGDVFFSTILHFSLHPSNPKPETLKPKT